MLKNISGYFSLFLDNICFLFWSQNMSIHAWKIYFGSTNNSEGPFLDPKQQFLSVYKFPVARVLKFSIHSSTLCSHFKDKLDVIDL